MDEGCDKMSGGRLSVRSWLKDRKRAVILLGIAARAWWLCFIFRFFPRQYYCFVSPDTIPGPAARIVRESNPLDEFAIIPELSSGLRPYDCVNVVMRGQSFGPGRLEKLTGPVFLVNWERREDMQDVYYVTADYLRAQMMVDAGLQPIFYIDMISMFLANAFHAYPEYAAVLKKIKAMPGTIICTLAYKYPLTAMAGTSAVWSVAAFAKLARRLNVYGWDQYHRHSLQGWSTWKVIQNMYMPDRRHAPASQLSEALVCYHYAFRFQELAHVRVDGRIGPLRNDLVLRRCCEQVLYR